MYSSDDLRCKTGIPSQIARQHHEKLPVKLLTVSPDNTTRHVGSAQAAFHSLRSSALPGTLSDSKSLTATQSSKAMARKARGLPLRVGLHKQSGHLPGCQQLVAGAGVAQTLPVLLPKICLQGVHGVMCLQHGEKVSHCHAVWADKRSPRRSTG